MQVRFLFTLRMLEEEKRSEYRVTISKNLYIMPYIWLVLWNIGNMTEIFKPPRGSVCTKRPCWLVVLTSHSIFVTGSWTVSFTLHCNSPRVNFLGTDFSTSFCLESLKFPPYPSLPYSTNLRPGDFPLTLKLWALWSLSHRKPFELVWACPLNREAIAHAETWSVDSL